MTDFNKILDKAKELEAKMKESQENIKKIRVEGVSGSNSVKVILDGEGEMQKIEISDQILKEEKSIVEDLIVESLRFYGHNCYYLPRKIVNEDTILGDAAESSFEDAYEVEMYLEGTEGFEGEGELYSKFGIETRDSASFILSVKT